MWLIYILVFLWTAFPTGFGAIMTTLYVPWLLVGLGIVLRGAGFAFRKFADTDDRARLFGVMFAASSLITPFFLGMIVGAVASGRVPAEGHGGLVDSWTGPTSWIGGTLGRARRAPSSPRSFLAADAQRAGDGDWRGGSDAGPGVRRRHRRRGLGRRSCRSTPTPTRSPTPRRGGPRRCSSSRRWPGSSALWLLHRQRWATARWAAVVAVAAIVVGWGVAQYPYLLTDELTLDDAAGARSDAHRSRRDVRFRRGHRVPALLWLFVLVNRREWATEPEP